MVGGEIMDELEALEIADKFVKDKKAKFEARGEGNKWFRVGEEIYVNTNGNKQSPFQLP